MATPNYQGAVNQTSTGNGASWFSRLGSMVRRSADTPSYAGNGQPSPGGGGIFGVGTPVYQTASATQSLPFVPCVPAVPMMPCDACPIDPNALAAGNIAIVVPRQS